MSELDLTSLILSCITIPLLLEEEEKQLKKKKREEMNEDDENLQIK